MKIGNISDLHYAPKTLTEVDRCVRFAVDRMIDEKCELCVISGDLLDHRVDLHSPAVSALLTQVKRLTECMPVLILQGTYSHDVPGSLDVFKTMGGRFPVFVADRICQVGLLKAFDRRTFLPSEGWAFTADDLSDCEEFAVIISCLPSINKGAVAALVGAESAAEAVGDYVYNLLKGWGPINIDARRRGVPTVLVSHGTVSGCITEQGVPMAGLDHEFTTGSLLAAETQAVMLGHIHQHQEWTGDGGRTIAYPGSIGRLHFGETRPKGFLIWEVLASIGPILNFIETPAKKLLEITFTGTPNMDELARLAVDAGGAHVRVRYSVDEEHRHVVDKTTIATLFAHAAEIKIEGHVNPIQRTRSEGIARMSLQDKLLKWCAVTETDSTHLIPRLAILDHMEPEAIVAETLGEKEKEKAA